MGGADDRNGKRSSSDKGHDKASSPVDVLHLKKRAQEEEDELEKEKKKEGGGGGEGGREGGRESAMVLTSTQAFL